MIKKLTRHGNSLALIIDKAILDLLNISPDTPLEIITDGHTLHLIPVRDEKRRKKLLEAIEEGNENYSNMLKKLAE